MALVSLKIRGRKVLDRARKSSGLGLYLLLHFTDVLLLSIPFAMVLRAIVRASAAAGVLDRSRLGGLGLFLLVLRFSRWFDIVECLLNQYRCHFEKRLLVGRGQG